MSLEDFYSLRLNSSICPDINFKFDIGKNITVQTKIYIQINKCFTGRKTCLSYSTN